VETKNPHSNQTVNTPLKNYYLWLMHRATCLLHPHMTDGSAIIPCLPTKQQCITNVPKTTNNRQQPTKEENELMVCVECFIYSTDG
jgi:hypothetical protein